MNNIKIFESPEFGQVRTIKKGDGVLFCASDIAKALGYSNPRKAIIDHCRCVTKCAIPHPQSPNKGMEVSFIPEGDVYRLIVRSKLPQAEKFERWVFDEVLPTIRKHGMYATDQLLDNPDFAIEVFQKLKEEREQNKQLQSENQYQKQLIQCQNRELSLAEMRQVINRVIRRVPKYKERWAELYKQFDMKFHMNTKVRAENSNTPRLDYIEKIGMLTELFDVACKLYESEVNGLIEEIYGRTEELFHPLRIVR